jgi:hypothetical protein
MPKYVVKSVSTKVYLTTVEADDEYDALEQVRSLEDWEDQDCDAFWEDDVVEQLDN